MHKISLKDWVILLTLVPTTLIGITLAGYFSYNRYAELDHYLTERSRSVIEPLAIASVEALTENKRDKLRNLVGFAHRSQSSIIKSITVFTKDNQIFVTSAYHGDIGLMRLSPNESIPETTTVTDNNDYLIFRTPIINEINLDSSSTGNNLSQGIVGYIAMQIDKNEIKYDQQSQVLVAFTLVILGVLINAIFSIRLIKNVTRPIKSMVQAVDRIREGKLESRVSGQLIGELNFLKNGVNAMAQSLGDYHDEMQKSIDQATIDLRESLEQFEIQNVELDIAKRKAQEANKVKSEFLANMSHELRTPLNGVIGFTRQVLKTPLTDTQRDYLQTIERSAANLLAIINDILDFSKLDAGKMVIEKVPFSLRESVEESLTLLAPSAHKKNIELSLRVNHNLPDSYIGDAMRIKQILINLASNAIKFTDDGYVNIEIDSELISQQSAVLKVTVTDSGIGMSAQQQESIFEAFGQADQSVTRLYGGTGLGLVISQRLVAEMNGEIGFFSEEKKGSTFWFTFQCEVNPIPESISLSPALLVKQRILYFESHHYSSVATTEILEKWQMQVTKVSNMVEVTEVLARQQFDLALIGHDATPTALNNLKELIHKIKQHVPIIHLAINSNSPNLQEALIVAGAKSCISKPITADKLQKVLAPSKMNLPAYEMQATENKLPIKVLAVDDNDANLKLINALLNEQVQEVMLATNGKEAVKLCENEKFALIFMDIQMPVMDGITALKNIKAHTFNEQTPIIAVTAHALSSEKDKLINEGFDSYMTKPIDEAMLKHIIYEYCDPQLLGQRLLTIADNQAPADKEEVLPNIESSPVPLAKVIDWQLALKRAGKKSKLAHDMLHGLVDSLPETKQLLESTLIAQDIEQLKVTIHKLNGACCYSGVPSLAQIVHHLETALKQGELIDDLEPEFSELFEHIDNVIHFAPQFFDELKQTTEVT
ncbi:two-component sensor histidine kinase BarA [Thalassotalea ganghwensis]